MSKLNMLHLLVRSKSHLVCRSLFSYFRIFTFFATCSRMGLIAPLGIQHREKRLNLNTEYSNLFAIKVKRTQKHTNLEFWLKSPSCSFEFPVCQMADQAACVLGADSSNHNCYLCDY